MRIPIVTVGMETKLKEIAIALAKYNLLALPVIDSEGVLRGIVTVDDVMELVVPKGWRRKRRKYV